MRILSFTLLLLSNCSGAQVRQRADGTYSVECGDKKACLERAQRLCGNEGYTVVGGHSNKKKYGVPGNEKLIGKDEIYIRCAKDRPLDTPDPTIGSWRLRQRDGDRPDPSAPVPPDAQPTATKPAGNHVCRPGETQRCVGPGACEGGQACLTDGSAFGPCDCGTPSSTEDKATKSSTEVTGP